MENEVTVAIGAFIVGCIVYWFVSRKVASAEKDLAYAQEMRDIIDNDKYKTKGRFED